MVIKIWGFKWGVVLKREGFEWRWFLMGMVSYVNDFEKGRFERGRFKRGMVFKGFDFEREGL